MTGGSVQLRAYRIARRAGATVHTACVESGIPLAEARLIELEDAKNPPPPEAFEPLNPAPSAPPEKEHDMASRKPKEPQVEQQHKPDPELAVRYYRNDIKPAQAKVGEHAQEQSTAYKAIKKLAHIQPGAAKFAFKLLEMEESKRDDFLRGFNALLAQLKIFMPRDLVDAAQGTTQAGVVPTADERPRPRLVTLPQSHPADDSDLNPEDPPATKDSADVDEEAGTDDDDDSAPDTLAAE